MENQIRDICNNIDGKMRKVVIIDNALTEGCHVKLDSGSDMFITDHGINDSRSPTYVGIGEMDEPMNGGYTTFYDDVNTRLVGDVGLSRIGDGLREKSGNEVRFSFRR